MRAPGCTPKTARARSLKMALSGRPGPSGAITRARSMTSRVHVQRADLVPDRARSPEGPNVSSAPACEYIAQPKRSSKPSMTSGGPLARSAVRSSKKMAPSPWTITRRSAKRRPARASGGASPGGSSVRSSVQIWVSSPLKITSW